MLLNEVSFVSFSVSSFFWQVLGEC
uniref:Uncharacterized protein n=1 Tax=Arundo donax TaxID=35708 RepID=A0A0A9FX71_ARUDO